MAVGAIENRIGCWPPWPRADLDEVTAPDRYGCRDGRPRAHIQDPMAMRRFTSRRSLRRRCLVEKSAKLVLTSGGD